MPVYPGAFVNIPLDASEAARGTFATAHVFNIPRHTQTGRVGR